MIRFRVEAWTLVLTLALLAAPQSRAEPGDLEMSFSLVVSSFLADATRNGVYATVPGNNTVAAVDRWLLEIWTGQGEGGARR